MWNPKIKLDNQSLSHASVRLVEHQTFAIASKMSRFVICSLLVVSFLTPSTLSVDVNEFLAQRERFLADESVRILGGGLTLSSNEQLVNTMLMTAKTLEFDQAFSTLNFTPATHFFLSKPAMLESEVYQFIRQMPKGNIHILQIAVKNMHQVFFEKLCNRRCFAYPRCGSYSGN